MMFMTVNPTHNETLFVYPQHSVLSDCNRSKTDVLAFKIHSSLNATRTQYANNTTVLNKFSTAWDVADDMIDNTKKGLTLTRDDLKKKEQMLLNKMGAIPQQERVYVDLKRQQEIYQGVYLVLLQKKEDAALKIRPAGLRRPSRGACLCLFALNACLAAAAVV